MWDAFLLMRKSSNLYQCFQKPFNTIMKIILENVNPKHYDWLKKMADALKFKVREIDISEEEEDEALEKAIEAGRNDDILSPEETSRFIDSLGR